MGRDDKPVAGLVLTGGGARSAYQVGVIKFLSDLYRGGEFPCSVYTGASAGAINVVALAAGAANHPETADRLWNIWKNLRHDTVFKSDTGSLLAIGVKILMDLSLGGQFIRPRSNYLLDTAPLRLLLQKEIYFPALWNNIRKGVVKGVAISAANYLTGTNIVFYDSATRSDDWVRSQRISRKTNLTLEHLMASTAIPVFFPPIALDGGFFGDGSVRLTSPLSPAIHLGSDKILAISLRCQPLFGPADELSMPGAKNIFMADIAGLLLNSIFMDSLESDIERLNRINRSLERMTDEARRTHPDRLRPVGLFTLTPSVDLGIMANEQFRHFPKFLQHLLKGIGATGESGNELLSYLAFDNSYTSKLLYLGYEDAKARKDDLLAFFGG